MDYITRMQAAKRGMIWQPLSYAKKAGKSSKKKKKDEPNCKNSQECNVGGKKYCIPKGKTCGGKVRARLDPRRVDDLKKSGGTFEGAIGGLKNGKKYQVTPEMLQAANKLGVSQLQLQSGRVPTSVQTELRRRFNQMTIGDSVTKPAPTPRTKQKDDLTSLRERFAQAKGQERLDLGGKIKEIETKERLATARNLPASKNVQIVYRLGGTTEDRIADMSDQFPAKKPDRPTKKEIDQQFKFGAMRIQDNQGTTETGFIRMPNGTIYEIAGGSRRAKLVKQEDDQPKPADKKADPPKDESKKAEQDLLFREYVLNKKPGVWEPVPLTAEEEAKFPKRGQEWFDAARQVAKEKPNLWNVTPTQINFALTQVETTLKGLAKEMGIKGELPPLPRNKTALRGLGASPASWKGPTKYTHSQAQIKALIKEGLVSEANASGIHEPTEKGKPLFDLLRTISYPVMYQEIPIDFPTPVGVSKKYNYTIGNTLKLLSWDGDITKF